MEDKFSLESMTRIPSLGDTCVNVATQPASQPASQSGTPDKSGRWAQYCLFFTLRPASHVNDRLVRHSLILPHDETETNSSEFAPQTYFY
jgi:hypothetical protein